MLRQNLTLVIRALWSKRIYTSIILLSLTVGFVCSNLLISFLVSETNADSFHKNKARIFQVFSNNPFGDDGQIPYIPDYMHDYFTTTYAEVENICQLATIDRTTLSAEKNALSDLMVLSVDSSFFTFFDFPIVAGGGSNCLAPGNIVLSRDKAVALFGGPDVVGKVVTLEAADTTVQLVVSAVVEKAPERSHLVFDALVNHATSDWNGGAAYVLLADAGMSQGLQSKINKDAQRPGLLGPGTIDYHFAPLTESYFSGFNKMRFMLTRSPMFITVGYIVCGLILFIAGFNFINLFLLFWQSRKKEIGIKKTLGVSPKGLLEFSMVETGVYIFAAYALSLVVTFLVIPVFNTVFEASISTDYFLNVKVMSLLGMIIFVAGISVVILSVAKQWRMKPVSLMTKDSTTVRFNGFLFTMQFMVSIALTVCTVTIIRQMDFLENAPLGFNRNVIQLDAPNKAAAKDVLVLKQKVGALATVNHVTACSGNPINGNSMVRYDLENGAFYSPNIFSGDDDFLKTLNLELLEGELLTEHSNGKLVNQKLIKLFNLKNPVGQRIPGTKDIIRGVVKDFTCSSFKQEIPPVIISYYNEGRALLVDFKGHGLAEVMPQLQQQWRSVFPESVFTYRIIQEDLMKKYKEDTFFYRIMIAFSVVSIVLSCFGLFALSWAVTEARTKEMGIRKVLGATSLDILNLLTLLFTKRIALAFVFAAPIGYYLMSQWLTRFANRIEMDAWIFVLSVILVGVVAVLTLSLQTVKATLTNPVDSLRSE